ncbi:hypothetical protein STEG23_038252, partial [Scotinomys teguina]
MCWLSWFLDPGGWSKAAAVGLYFIFPGICTLSLCTLIVHLKHVTTNSSKESSGAVQMMPLDKLNTVNSRLPEMMSAAINEQSRVLRRILLQHKFAMSANMTVYGSE